jgi:hypothetical protein
MGKLLITPIAGQNYTILFALGSLSFLIVEFVVLFLPELGAKAMAKAVSKSAETINREIVKPK